MIVPRLLDHAATKTYLSKFNIYNIMIITRGEMWSACIGQLALGLAQKL